MDSIGTAALAPFIAFASVTSDYFVGYVLASFAVAGLIAWRRGKSLAWVFPKSVYAHPSVRLDVLMYLVNWHLLLALPLAALMATSGAWVAGWLLMPFGDGGFLAAGWASNLLFTIVLFAAADAGIAYGHLLLHRLPLLWEFHKVHHSAPVLMPLTAARQHPVDSVVVTLFSMLFFGIAHRVMTWSVAGGGVSEVELMGRSIAVLLFSAVFLHLRHTHVWLSFGPVLGKWILSPAHHQIHHSIDKRHWDKNMGLYLAVWDRMFGTLYVPAVKDEEITFGIGDGTDAAYGTLSGAYLLPFRRAYQRLSGKMKDVTAGDPA